MKTSEAPPPGWYPDPDGGVRLRWWEGTDWSDRYRSRPSAGVGFVAVPAPAPAAQENAAAELERRGQPRVGSNRPGTEEIVAHVRQVARAEIDRGADLFSARARAATRQIEPLITQYTSRLFRWVRLLAVIAVVMLIAWLLFELIAQVSFFNWLGDRIDSLVNEASGG